MNDFIMSSKIINRSVNNNIHYISLSFANTFLTLHKILPVFKNLRNTSNNLNILIHRFNSIDQLR